uniref:Zinc finger, CCHC-type n=1 Tax=Tanacetum cinerariifolium TaxID=118510 RepID=A0A699KNQ8_TANCI|nr:zinc finger, CCHC-type [Tanacetum cinerariifolium]
MASLMFFGSVRITEGIVDRMYAYLTNLHDETMAPLVDMTIAQKNRGTLAALSIIRAASTSVPFCLLTTPFGSVRTILMKLNLHEQTLPKNNAPALYAIQAGNVQKVNKHKNYNPKWLLGDKIMGRTKNKQAYAPKPKIPPLAKRENPAKDSICHECGETRRWKRNCPQYLAELLKKKKNAASRAGGSGIFVIKLNTILNRSWIYDTGCGTHICNTTQGLRASRKLKPRALSLYVGNGQREALKAIDIFIFVPRVDYRFF